MFGDTKDAEKGIEKQQAKTRVKGNHAPSPIIQHTEQRQSAGCSQPDIRDVFTG